VTDDDVTLTRRDLLRAGKGAAVGALVGGLIGKWNAYEEGKLAAPIEHTKPKKRELTEAEKEAANRKWMASRVQYRGDGLPPDYPEESKPPAEPEAAVQGKGMTAKEAGQIIGGAASGALTGAMVTLAGPLGRCAAKSVDDL
jgi:hypothetical protein